MVGLAALAGPIVALLFQRGEFGAADTVYTAQALVGYAVGLPAFSATRIAAQTFYALGDIRTPVYVGFASVAVNVGLALALMWPLAHTGLALASSLSSYVNLLGPLRAAPSAPRAPRWAGPRPLARAHADRLGDPARLVRVARAHRSPDTARGGRSLALASGVLVYAAVAAALRAPELGALRGLLRRRGARGLPSDGGQ